MKGNAMTEKKILPAITITPMDETGNLILRSLVAEGEVGGKNFAVATATNGSLVINCNDKQWVVSMHDILNELLPLMLAE